VVVWVAWGRWLGVSRREGVAVVATIVTRHQAAVKQLQRAGYSVTSDPRMAGPPCRRDLLSSGRLLSGNPDIEADMVREPTLTHSGHRTIWSFIQSRTAGRVAP
jgi:hypothetical protein